MTYPTPVKFRVIPRLIDHETDAVLHECTVLGDLETPFLSRWKWTCSCGGRGRWQRQSSFVSVFQWFKHAYRTEGVSWPRSSQPAYDWMTKERAQ